MGSLFRVSRVAAANARNGANPFNSIILLQIGSTSRRNEHAMRDNFGRKASQIAVSGDDM
jgi:hypothetical protein